MWRTISESSYRSAFDRFGGSFKVHPDVIALAEKLSRRRVRYLGFSRWGKLHAAVPLWDSHIASTNSALRYIGHPDLLDVGDEEVILPIAQSARIALPFQSDLLSDLQAASITNATRANGPPLMIADGLTTGRAPRSPETLSKLRRLHRRFLQSGGQERPIASLSAEEIAQEYSRLFAKRWGWEPHGMANLTEVFAALKDLMFGSVLLETDKTVAIAINYKVECPRWLLINGINQAVDPDRKDRSLGTLLMYLNLKGAEELAIHSNKEMRFSFGTLDHDYKKQWSQDVPTFSLGTVRRPAIIGWMDRIRT